MSEAPVDVLVAGYQDLVAELTAAADMDVIKDLTRTLQLSPVGEFTLSGKILNLPASGGAGPGGVGTVRPTLDLMPHDLTPLDNPPATQTTIVVATTVDPSGNFTIQHVHPGVYDLYASAQETSGITRVIRSGTITIQVAGDQTGLSVPLTIGAPLNGKVVVSGDSAPTPLNAIRLAFQPTERMPPALVSRIGAITVDREGSFTAPSVPQGHYTITVSGLPSPGYVADIRYAGVSVFDDGIDIQQDSKPLEVIVNGSGITMQGSVHAGWRGCCECNCRAGTTGIQTQKYGLVQDRKDGLAGPLRHLQCSPRVLHRVCMGQQCHHRSLAEQRISFEAARTG
jgi:hypothetical protein